ncbi:hypothetical protein TVAG_241120 [Trichomonas vaginalis G3]|uniref:Uncharacterized protein n=1 Tax=Trichomonas vaginalis (strain ATCC PRA-98 / G3) TaxID=412133 RepID=A2F6B5_TRIV3|nr:Ankyrin repeat family [Trichomonas vaginalis G3]EAX99536.1 hypothetical protein TVAG_241120 [Trichomonas vaginalis G3]KAI5532851.1 Ankyrin repeat family [Trichomonas vaginalis G3]|eukprot:XP_001312466.1 hypothetical protein [Trichomonas vaginalis G3]
MALNNSKEIVENLISYGANINEKVNDGETALHYAATYNIRKIPSSKRPIWQKTNLWEKLI